MGTNPNTTENKNIKKVMTANGVFKQKSKLRAITHNPGGLLVNILIQHFKKVIK